MEENRNEAGKNDNRQSEFMGPLLSILAELFMMEFISREIHYQMRMVFAQMY